MKFILTYVIVDASGYCDYNKTHEAEFDAENEIQARLNFQRENPNLQVVKAEIAHPFTLYYYVKDVSGYYNRKDERNTTRWHKDAVHAVLSFLKENPNCYVFEAC